MIMPDEESLRRAGIIPTTALPHESTGETGSLHSPSVMMSWLNYTTPARYKVIEPEMICYTTPAGSSRSERDLVILDTKSNREFTITIKGTSCPEIANLHDKIRSLLLQEKLS